MLNPELYTNIDRTRMRQLRHPKSDYRLMMRRVARAFSVTFAAAAEAFDQAVKDVVERMDQFVIDNTTTEQQIEYLKDWAFDNHARLELEGEVGFGRECVGILKDGSYPAYQTFDPKTFAATYYLEEAKPPADVTDAYHKHPCLAVLGRGDEAIRQLFVWVKHLEKNGIVIEVWDRNPDSFIDLILHGVVVPVLVKEGSQNGV